MWTLTRRDVGIVLGAAVLSHQFAQRDTFPRMALRVIVSAPAGQGQDLVAQLAAEHLGTVLGQPFAVEHKSVAGGIVALSKAPADGHTILIFDSAPLNFGSAFGGGPEDAAPDVTVASGFASCPLILAVRHGLAAGTFAEFLRLASARGGNTTYAYSTPQLLLRMEYLGARASLRLTAIAYPTETAAVSALAEGNVDSMLCDWPTIQQAFLRGEVRLIAVAAKQRVPELRDVPTIAESGFRGFETGAFLVLAVRSGASPAILHRLHQAVAEVLQHEEIQRQMLRLGMQPDGASPGEAEIRIEIDRQRYKVLAQAASSLRGH